MFKLSSFIVQTLLQPSWNNFAHSAANLWGDDAHFLSDELLQLLQTSRVPFIHIVSPHPPYEKITWGQVTWPRRPLNRAPLSNPPSCKMLVEQLSAFHCEIGRRSILHELQVLIQRKDMFLKNIQVDICIHGALNEDRTNDKRCRPRL